MNSHETSPRASGFAESLGTEGQTCSKRARTVDYEIVTSHTFLVASQYFLVVCHWGHHPGVSPGMKFLAIPLLRLPPMQEQNKMSETNAKQNCGMSHPVLPSVVPSESTGHLFMAPSSPRQGFSTSAQLFLWVGQFLRYFQKLFFNYG